MKESTKYKALMWLNIFLVIAWPLVLIGHTSVWMGFLIGVLWWDDFQDIFTYYEKYKECEEFGD